MASKMASKMASDEGASFSSYEESLRYIEEKEKETGYIYLKKKPQLNIETDSYDLKRIIFKDFTPCVKTGQEERRCVFEKNQKKHLKVQESASKYSKTKKIKELKNQNATLRMKELRFKVRYFNAHSHHDKVNQKVQKKLDSAVAGSRPGEPRYSLRSRAPTTKTTPALLELDDNPAGIIDHLFLDNDGDDDNVYSLPKRILVPDTPLEEQRLLQPWHGDEA